MIVISDLYGDGDVEDELSKTEYRNIRKTFSSQEWKEGTFILLNMLMKYKKRLSVACFSQMFAQLNGINMVSDYAPMIFEWLVGLVQAILMTGINSIVYVLSTIPPWYLVDGWGRKLLLSVWRCCHGYTIISDFVFIIP